MALPNKETVIRYNNKRKTTVFVSNMDSLRDFQVGFQSNTVFALCTEFPAESLE